MTKERSNLPERRIGTLVRETECHDSRAREGAWHLGGERWTGATSGRGLLLGGFHFNNRKYGDDDLIVGSVNPFELFLIFVELVEAEERSDTRIDYMIDQTHNIEPKIEAMLLSVMNLQEACAKALLVDRAALTESRHSGDVLGAHRLLLDPYSTDVRPLCSKVREDLGGAADPITTFKESGYAERMAEEHGQGAGAGWN